MKPWTRPFALSLLSFVVATAHADRYPSPEQPHVAHATARLTSAQVRAELQIWHESGLAFYERLGHADHSAEPGLADARARFEFLMASERHAQLVQHFSVRRDTPPSSGVDLRAVRSQPSGITRAEVLADLKDWRESGMAEFDNTDSAGNGVSGAYEAAQARYAQRREQRLFAKRLQRSQQG